MTYNQFLDTLATPTIGSSQNTDTHLQLQKHTQYTEEDYYLNVVRFKTDILMGVAKTNQSVVAKQLNMTQTKLSNILDILKVL